ncbi:hypothetical protein [Humibacillus sp. DSM 29435]|uniref:hypothetical protein n=1 Tax=Humibacillus sp. DSM 29435 TaxID=1869167 RepID=UPI000A783FCB|nr:hypothetical protein [Humibacillus sp. DSM 29435]
MGMIRRGSGRARRDTDQSRGRARFGGFLLLLVGLGWLIADRLLRGYFPLAWGGPNIGGGALLVLAIVAAASGAVLVALNFRRREGSDRGARLPGVGSWIGLALGGALAVGWVVVSVVEPADPDAGLNGQVGVTVSATGSPVLVVEVCRGSTTTVTINGPHREGQPNTVLAQFDAALPVTSSVLLDILHPPAAWSARPGSSLSAAAPEDLMIASGQGHQSQLRQVDFTVADLESLDVDTVLYTDVTGHPRVPSSTFHSVACR